MNEQQLRTRAEAECLDLLGNGTIIVRIAAQGRHEKADSCLGLFREWAVRQASPALIIRTGSMGYDDLEPIALIERPGNPAVCFSHLDEEAITQVIRDLSADNMNARPDAALAAVMPLLQLQKRIALRNCGQVDTALLNYLDDRRAVPSPRTCGTSLPSLSGKPIMIHYIETLANISAVFQKGAEFLNQCGTADSRGTKVVSLSGEVPHPYTVEVHPIGVCRLCVVEIDGMEGPQTSCTTPAEEN